MWVLNITVLIVLITGWPYIIGLTFGYFFSVKILVFFNEILGKACSFRIYIPFCYSFNPQSATVYIKN